MNRSNDTVYKKNLLKATTSKTENLSEGLFFEDILNSIL